MHTKRIENMFSQRLSPGNDSATREGLPLAFDLALERARRREAEGVSELYRQFLPGVFGYIATRVPDRTTAEDLTSEIFLQMVEGIERVRARDEAQFAAWLFQIARVTVAGYYRQAKKQPVFVSLEPMVVRETWTGSEALLTDSEEADPVSRAEFREEWGQVVQAMNMLTEEQRLVLVGRLVIGYNVEDVAEMLGKKANAIKALQFRALNSLHRLLQKNIAVDSAKKNRRGM